MTQLFTPAARTADTPLSPIWRYIQLDQFTCPSGSATEAVRKGLFGLLQRFGMGSPPKVFSVAQDELQSLPDDLCSQVAPDPDWHEAAAVLDARISQARSATPSSSQVQVIVGGPSSGTAEVVRCWAKTHGITVIEPPPPEDILTGGREWFERVIARQQTSPVVIPQLERYYLRHQHGLCLIRRLLPWLLEQPCACLIGCSSWAWAYFDKALHATQLFPAAWALEALTHQQLQHWFTNLTARQGKSQFLFRQTNNGKFVIPPSCRQTAGDDSGTPHNRADKTHPEREESDFLVNLAAYSRGNPGVALAVWRHGLRLGPDQPQAETDQPGPSPHPTDQTIWLQAWPQLHLPSVSDTADRNTLQVLQTLLLHESLAPDLLSELLPLSAFEVSQIVSRLHNAGLLSITDNDWRVTPLGYPAVRQALAAEGYLVDAL